MSAASSKSSGRSAGNFAGPPNRRDPNSTARSPSTRNNPSASSSVMSVHLDDHGGAHSAAGAHGQHADAAAAATKFVDGGGDHAGPRGGNGVAQADARAVDIDDFFVETQFAGTGYGLGGERLVDLEQRHVFDLATCQLECFGD